MKKNLKSQAGGALVEFAITIPLLMLLLVGLIEIGRLTYFGIQVANAARAGAQYGALSNPNTTGENMQVAAQNDGRNSIANLQTTAQYVCACWKSSSGTMTPTAPSVAACSVPCSTGGHTVTYAQVSVSGTMRPLFDYGFLGLPDRWVVTRIATIRVLQAQ
jgi:Flp pilus assembly protein TadG